MSMSDKFQFLSLCTSNIHSMDHQLYKEGGWGRGVGKGFRGRKGVNWEGQEERDKRDEG